MTPHAPTLSSRNHVYIGFCNHSIKNAIIIIIIIIIICAAFTAGQRETPLKCFIFTFLTHTQKKHIWLIYARYSASVFVKTKCQHRHENGIMGFYIALLDLRTYRGGPLCCCTSLMFTLTWNGLIYMYTGRILLITAALSLNHMQWIMQMRVKCKFIHRRFIFTIMATSQGWSTAWKKS